MEILSLSTKTKFYYKPSLWIDISIGDYVLQLLTEWYWRGRGVGGVGGVEEEPMLM